MYRGNYLLSFINDGPVFHMHKEMTKEALKFLSIVFRESEQLLMAAA